MQVERLNKEIFELPDEHPACRFLREFVECRRECVGLEASDDPIDQEWFSETDQQVWTYSKFAYSFLAFDIVLDGWLGHAAGRTLNEQYWLDQLPRWSQLLRECEARATTDNNTAILPIIAKVKRLFVLWEQSIRARETGDF